MMAEKMSDLIRGKTPLSPDYREFYRAKNFRTEQR